MKAVLYHYLTPHPKRHGQVSDPIPKTTATRPSHKHWPTKATRPAIKSFLKANKPGIVAHISSMSGRTTRLAVPIHCATKAYINHFVQAFAELDQKKNIRVVAVAPGWVTQFLKPKWRLGSLPFSILMYISLPNSMVRTPLWFRENPDKLKSVGEGDIWIEPSEIAEVLPKLCEDQAYPLTRRRPTRIWSVPEHQNEKKACS